MAARRGPTIDQTSALSSSVSAIRAMGSEESAKWGTRTRSKCPRSRCPRTKSPNLHRNNFGSHPPFQGQAHDNQRQLRRAAAVEYERKAWAPPKIAVDVTK